MATKINYKKTSNYPHLLYGLTTEEAKNRLKEMNKEYAMYKNHDLTIAENDCGRICDIERILLKMGYLKAEAKYLSRYTFVVTSEYYAELVECGPGCFLKANRWLWSQYEYINTIKELSEKCLSMSSSEIREVAINRMCEIPLT